MNKIGMVIVFAVVATVAGLGGYAVAHVVTGQAEVRISARQLDDGRVEFALQQRVDGQWGDRLLAAARYFPSEVAHSRWLNSSPYKIETLSEPGTGLNESQSSGQQGSASVSGIVTQPVNKAYEGGRILTLVDRDDFTDELQSAIVVSGDGSYESWEDPMMLWISCLEGARRVSFHNLPLSDIGTGSRSDEYRVTYRFDSHPAVTETWGTTADHIAIAPDSVAFYDQLLSSRTLLMRFSGYSEADTATFNLTGVFSTQIQPNIEHCGKY